MRINMCLRSLQKSSRSEFELDYHPSMQAFLYALLQESPFEQVRKLHNFPEKIPPFCFSEIKGSFGKKGEILENPEKCSKPIRDRYQVIVSTPSSEIGMSLLMSLNKRVWEKSPVNLKMSSFAIEKISLPTIKILPNDILFTDSPIILKSTGNSERQSKYVLYGNDKKVSKNFIQDPDLFEKCLEKNMAWKLKSFGQEGKNILNYLQHLPIKGRRKITLPLFSMSNGNPYFVIGTRNKFKIKDSCPPSVLSALNYLFDFGFGAHNSYGMGFMMKEVSGNV